MTPGLLKAWLIGFIIGLLPYCAVAWLFVVATDAKLLDFWQALGALYLLRLMFSMIEGTSATLAWRLYGRKRAVQSLVDVFRFNQLPPKKYIEDDFGDYIARIINDAPPRKPDPVRTCQDIHSFLLNAENQGLLAGTRLTQAYELAFKEHMAKLPQPSVSRYT